MDQDGDGAVMPVLEPGVTQSIFATLCTTHHAAAGTYTGTLIPTGLPSDAGSLAQRLPLVVARVPVSVVVWAIVLPAVNATEAFSTVFGFDDAVVTNPRWRDPSGGAAGGTAAALRGRWWILPVC